MSKLNHHHAICPIPEEMQNRSEKLIGEFINPKRKGKSRAKIWINAHDARADKIHGRINMPNVKMSLHAHNLGWLGNYISSKIMI